MMNKLYPMVSGLSNDMYSVMRSIEILLMSIKTERKTFQKIEGKMKDYREKVEELSNGMLTKQGCSVSAVL